MNITDKRPGRNPITFADIEVGALFSPANHADIICMKTREFCGAIIKTNGVNLRTGMVYHAVPDEEVVPIDNYEFNIF